MKTIKMFTLTVVAMFISAVLFAGDNKKNDPVKKDAPAGKEASKDADSKNPNYKNGYYRHHAPPAPEPEVFSFVGTWDELFLNPFHFPWTGTYVVKDDGTCENWGGGIEPVRVGTWEVGADGVVYVTWNDGNSAILVVLDADNLAGTDGCGISTITLTRQ